MLKEFNLNNAHSSWRSCLKAGLQLIDQEYLQTLKESTSWLPGADAIFNAFSIPVNQVNYILLGESPYPRAASANGYAFWDNAVTDIWTETGLSKKVNRATSLRNIMKMLLVADGKLSPDDTSQHAIAQLDKTHLIQTLPEFFNHLIQQGFLLLNATPVFQLDKVKKDAKHWQPFLKHIFDFLYQAQPSAKIILLGNIANQIDALLQHNPLNRIYSEHPYNISFIKNTHMQDFFRPLNLLQNNTDC